MRKIWIIVFFSGVAIGVVSTLLFQAIRGAAGHPDPSLLKDWWSIAFATLAVLLSAGALYYNWMKSKQDTFLSIHEKMISSDLQEGRRLLLSKIKSFEDADRLLQEEPEQYQKVNRALAMYDVMGVYVKRGYILKSWVMEEWGPGLARAREPGLHFIEHRRRQGIASMWKNFDDLSFEAVGMERGSKKR